MAGPQPEERITTPIFYQSWRDMTFLHWRYDPAVVASRLPPGVEPHLYDGWAWVGLTPFKVENFRVPLVPPLGPLSTFPETNLRTYVIGPGGGDGLWFFTLEVDSLVTTLGARIGFGVPYRWAEMQVDWDGPLIRYVSTRRGGPAPGHRIIVEPGDPFAEGELDELAHWLTGRWRGWTKIAGRWADVPVQHQPWPLRRGHIVTLKEDLLASAGLPDPNAPPLVHFSPGVDARFGPPRFHR